MSIGWWVLDSLQKVFPESAPPVDAPRHIELWAARNETEDAQVAFRIPEKAPVRKASFSFTALKGPRRHLIGPEHCRASWEWYTYVHANPPANTDPATVLRKAPAFFPDAFLEEPEIALRSGLTQPAWVSVRVPLGTPAGTYRGRVAFVMEYKNTGKSERIEVPLILHVWPFELPSKPSLHHTEWFFPPVLAQYYNLEPWSEPHWQWIGRVADDMARHRQDMILTDFPQLVRVTDLGHGKLAFDFSRLDRWLDIFQGAGVEWIEGSHIASRIGEWESPFALNRWSPLTPSGRPVDTARERMSEVEFEPYTEQLLKAVHAHLRARGLASRYVQHVADEPVPANERSWCRLAAKVRKWLPGIRRIDAIMAEGMEGFCEIRVPQIQEIREPSRRRPPEELWSYVCLAPQGIYPNRFLDYPSIRNRIIFWLSWTLNLRGFLHWGYNCWRTWSGVPVDIPISPWMDATGGSIHCHDIQPLPAGDPHIVYPGRRSICSSIRWETVRKGMEDYELLRLLESRVRKSRSAASRRREEGRRLLAHVRNAVAPDPARHTHEAGLLQSVRRQIGETVAALGQLRAARGRSRPAPQERAGHRPSH